MARDPRGRPDPAEPHHRFFVDVPLAAGAHTAVDALAPQLAAVLRLAPGDHILLLDGSGWEYIAVLETLTRTHAAVHLLDRRRNAAEPAAQLTLFPCSLKQDKFEWVLQKGTELGVARFVPVVSARSVVRPAAALQAKYPRWRAILREAAEQCGRGRIPELAAPLEWPAAAAARVGAGFLPWEEGAAAPPLLDALQQWAAAAPAPSLAAPALSIAIGPEGGLEAAEVAAAQAHDWQIVTLGPRILRAETAALAAAALALAYCEQIAQPKQ